MGIARAALVIMVGNVLSRLLGLVREQVIAGLFGAGNLVDAFTAASRLPTTVYDFLIGGMISAALVPVFSDYASREKNDDNEAELWRLASVVLSIASIVLALAMLTIGLLAPQLMGIFAAGYDEEVRQLSIGLVRYMLPAVFFMGLSGILTALLYSRQNFAVPAFCIAIYNASIVVAALLFHQSLNVYSLIVGMVAGAFLQAAVQLAGLRGMKLSLLLDWRNPGLRRILSLYLPVALGLVVSAVGVAIDTNLASHTGEGSLAAMRYATTLTQFPLGLVASAVSFAVLPSLSRLSQGDVSKPLVARQEASLMPMEPSPSPSPAAAGEGEARPLSLWERARVRVAPKSSTDKQFRKPESDPEDLTAYKATFALGFKMILIAILPATVGLVALREPFIQLAFQHGEFSATDTGRTALAFLAYSPGLPAAALDQLLIFAFYARKNTVTPVLVGVMGVLVYLAVGLSLVGPLGMPGLALANSAQLISHALVMFLLLWRALGGLLGLGLGSAALKTSAASLIMGVCCYALFAAFQTLTDVSTLAGLASALAATGAFAAAVYIVLLVAFRVEEVGLAWAAVKLRLGI